MSGERAAPGAAWSEDTSAEFERYADCFVPQREHQSQLIVRLAASLPPPVHAVELCCGTGELAAALMQADAVASIRCLDGSPHMLGLAGERLERFGPRATVARFDIHAREWRESLQADLVVIALALHHLMAPEKRDLLHALAGRITPGGLVVIADLYDPRTQVGRLIAARQWEQEVAACSQARYGDARGLQAFRALHWNWFAEPDPSDHVETLAAQLQLLAGAGFVATDVHWAHAGHLVLSAVAPERTSSRPD